MQRFIIDAIQSRQVTIAAYHQPELTKRCREVLLLQYFGFEQHEIANLLGTSENTVKNQLHQARSSLVPPSLAPTRGNSALWVALHRHCCMATPFAMIEALH